MKIIKILIVVIFSFNYLYSQNIKELDNFIVKSDYESLIKYLEYNGYKSDDFISEIEMDNKYYLFKGTFIKKYENFTSSGIKHKVIKYNIEVFEEEGNSISEINCSYSTNIDLEKTFILQNQHNDFSRLLNSQQFTYISDDELLSIGAFEDIGRYLPWENESNTLEALDQIKVYNIFIKEKKKQNHSIYLQNRNSNLGLISDLSMRNEYVDPVIGFRGYITFKKRLNNKKSTNDNYIKFKLIKKGNLYYLPLKFGKLVKLYVIDSGASEMSIDDETYRYFLSENRITIKNKLPDATFIIADGSKIVLKRVIVPSFKIEDYEFENIKSSIVKKGEPLLLGKAFLNYFKSWKIDNINSELILENN